MIKNLAVAFYIFCFLKIHRHRVAPGLASCAIRLCSSSSNSEDQRLYQRASWKHALAGLLTGAGAVLVYGLHHHKVTKGHVLICVCCDRAKFH